MRITSETAYRNLLGDLERISERMQKTQLEVSSGKKLHRPSDNPTDVSDVVRIQAEQGEIFQYQDNVATAKSRLNFADSTLQGVETMIERVRSLALLSLSNVGTASVQASEVSGLREQLLGAANSSFEGQALFAGSNIDGPAYTEASDGTITYTGNDQAVRLQVGRSATLQTQVPGNEIFSGPIDVFASIKTLVTAMNAGNKSSIQAEVTRLENFSTVIGQASGKVGGLVNIADSISQELTRYSLARAEERSRLEDADLPTALTDFTQAQNALQAATAIGARISNISILNYLS